MIIHIVPDDWYGNVEVKEFSTYKNGIYSAGNISVYGTDIKYDDGMEVEQAYVFESEVIYTEGDK